MSSWPRAILALAFASAQAASTDPLIRETAIGKVSDHVHVISDLNVGLVPNVGIVVGTRATLVVDTGLGPRNGETVRRIATGLSRTNELYVVSTHFHPEHALGESAFPDTIKLIRARHSSRTSTSSGLRWRKRSRAGHPLT